MSSTFSPAGGSPAQTCQRCQAPLSPLEVICGRCGYQNGVGQSNTMQPQNQPFAGENAGSPGPKKGLLQQYANPQGSQVSAAPLPGAPVPPIQASVGPYAESSSGINFLPYQSQTSGTNLSMFKSQPGSGQLPPAQAALPSQPPAQPYQPQSSGTSLSMFKSQSGGGQFPPTQSAHPSKPLVPPTQPNAGYPPVVPQPPQPGVTGANNLYGVLPQSPTSGQPGVTGVNNLYGAYPPPPLSGQPGVTGANNLYGAIPPAPQQVRNTDALNGGNSGFFSAGPMSASRPMPSAPISSLSRPMPSMSMKTPSMAYRAQYAPQIPRAPLGAEEDESPNWIRLTIIVVVLLLLAGGGYLGFVRLMPQSTAQTTVKKIVSYQPTGTPLFSDSFASNIYGWNLQNDGATYITTIGNNTLTLECNANKLLWEPVPGSRTYDNFQVAFDAILSKGDQNNGYGVYIRGASSNTSDLASYYRFELYGDASYAVFKGTSDAAGKTTDTKLVDYTGSSLINKKGKVNHVLIIANGSKLTLMVNGEALKTITDTSYTAGTIALFVSNLPEATPGVRAQFSNFAIYPYPMK